MVRSDFNLGLTEITQFIIVENRKRRIDFNSVTNMSFWEPGSNFGIFKEALKKSL